MEAGAFEVLMANKTLEQKIKDLETQGEELLAEVEAAGVEFSHVTWAAMNFTQAIHWLKRGIE